MKRRRECPDLVVPPDRHASLEVPVGYPRRQFPQPLDVTAGSIAERKGERRAESQTEEECDENEVSIMAAQEHGLSSEHHGDCHDCTGRRSHQMQGRGDAADPSGESPYSEKHTDGGDGGQQIDPGENQAIARSGLHGRLGHQQDAGDQQGGREGQPSHPRNR